jgi:hypothetical protein
MSLLASLSAILLDYLEILQLHFDSMYLSKFQQPKALNLQWAGFCKGWQSERNAQQLWEAHLVSFLGSIQICSSTQLLR